MPRRLSFEGDETVGYSFLHEAEQELFSLKERMRALGQTQGSFHAVVGEGRGLVYGYVLPTGLEALHIVASPGPGDVAQYDYADPITPDFLSGYLVSGGLREVRGEEVVRDFRPSILSAKLHPKEVPSGTGRANMVRRLAIRPGEIAGMRSGEDIAQAAVIRPTLYSGTMRKVIQFLLGMGKQFSNESIYDAAEPELPDEILEIEEDGTIINEDGEAVDNKATETAYESMVKSQGVRLYYDYRFQRTHGLTKGADGKWWVVEISESNGILMMPLPICKYTDLPEFRAKCETLSDGEALVVLDLFGGFPSGEPFPTDAKARESAVRSGRILQPKTAADLADFYSLEGYSSIMGWAFSDSGGEAHNTGYAFDDAGYARGSHFACQMTIGAFDVIEPDPSGESLKSLMAESGQSKEVLSEINWKIDRFTEQQILDFLALATTKTASEIFAAVDAVVLAPSAVATVSFKRVSEGPLWHRALYGAQVKFPEPILGGCISAPIYQENWSLPPIDCDTTLHVFFIGEELKWVKYYVRNGADSTRVVADSYTGREDIPVGDFYLERHSGEYGVAPSVYTNDYDDRVERGTTIYTERHKRRFSGYYEYLTQSLGSGDRVADFTDRSFDPPIPANNIDTAPYIWRNAKFAYEKWTSLRTSYQQRTAVMIPTEDRCAYFYTIEETNSGGLDSYVFSYVPVSDPYVGVYDWPRRDSYAIQSMSKSQSVGSQIWPNHQERIDFADNGNWVPVGADVRSIVTNQSISLGWFTREVATLAPVTASMTCYLVCGSEFAPLQVFSRNKTGSDFYPTRWFWQSPDPETGIVDTIQETHNALGEATSLVYSQDINTTDRDLRGLPDHQVLKSVMPTFIGPFDG